VNILIAPDSFKGSLTAVRAAEIIADAILLMDPAARCILCPQADGGDGTLEVLHRSLGGEIQHHAVVDPLGRSVTSPWLRLPDGSALIESASVIGWKLLSASERNPARVNSKGLGLLLRHVLDTGVSHVFVGLGGTATNDAGLGFADGLGARIRYVQDPGSDVLKAMQSVLEVSLECDLVSAEVTALVDVQNPLCGPHGATAVYGSQKGVLPKQREAFDKAVAHVADIACQDVRRIDIDIQGMGAAGGLGFALACFCNASFQSGAGFVRHATGFAAALHQADFVITGEGRLDAQTKEGKTVSGIVEEARSRNIPVVAFAGVVDGDAAKIASALGLHTAVSVLPEGMSVHDGMEQAEELLAQAVTNVWQEISSAR
jgi:glycerate kinase